MNVRFVCYIPAGIHRSPLVRFCSDPPRSGSHEERFHQSARWCSAEKNKQEECKVDHGERSKKRNEGRLTSRTCCTSTVVMNPLLSLSNLWKRFLYLEHKLEKMLKKNDTRMQKNLVTLCVFGEKRRTFTGLLPGSPGWSQTSWSAAQIETCIPSHDTETSLLLPAPPEGNISKGIQV